MSAVDGLEPIREGGMPMQSIEQDFRAIWRARTGDLQVGHAHFWDRALSRRQLLKLATGAGGAALTSGLWAPALAEAGSGITSAAPRPVPPNPALGGLHFNLPGLNAEPSSITDLNGVVGVGAVKGTGTGSSGGTTQTLYFDVDNRFMRGEYVGEDGKLHHGTFAFT
jgi:hypothetical protein